MSTHEVGEVSVGYGDKVTRMTVSGGSGWGGDGINFYRVIMYPDAESVGPICLTVPAAKELRGLIDIAIAAYDDEPVRCTPEEMKRKELDERMLNFDVDFRRFRRMFVGHQAGEVTKEQLDAFTRYMQQEYPMEDFPMSKEGEE